MSAGDIVSRLEAEASEWVSGEGDILWRDVSVIDGFAQGNFLAVERDSGEVTLLRTWATEGSPVSVSVDLRMDYDRFSGEIDDAGFPHAFMGGGEDLEQAFRASLLGEHAEIVWKSVADGRNASFLARTWKAGRDEQVVGGRVSPAEDGRLVAEIGFREALASFRQPRPASPRR